jgi:hypothetical protein
VIGLLLVIALVLTVLPPLSGSMDDAQGLWRFAYFKRLQMLALQF